MTDRRRRPPRVASLGLDLLLRGGAAEAVRGDIEERFARRAGSAGARRWYRRQATRTLLAWWRPAAVRERRRARLRPHRRPRPLSLSATRDHHDPPPGSLSMTSVLHDLRTARRSLAARPLFTVLVVGALALGIGATTTIYSIVDGVLLRPLPYDDPGRLVVVGSTSPQHHSEALTDASASYRLMGPSVGNFIDWRDRTRTVEGLTAAEPRRYDIRTDDGPVPLAAAAVAPGFFELFGVVPEHGRRFAAAEYRTGADAVALLAHGTWVARFGADPDIVGQRLDTTSGPLEIVGVLPASFQPPEGVGAGDTAFWVPLAEDADAYAHRGTRTIYVLGRLHDDASLSAARAEFWALGEQVADEHPDGNVFEDGTQFGTGVNRLHDETVEGQSGLLLPLLGAVFLLLLIACANVANLCLAQGLDRQRELAVRAALGAGRGRIVRLLLTESVLLAMIAGAAGAALAHFGVRAFVAFNPGYMPRLGDVGVDLRVLGFALAISCVTGIVFGLFPALHLSRSGASEALKIGAAGGSSPGRRRFRTALVVVEAALAVVLSVGSGLLFHSFVQLRAVDPGFDPADLTTFVVSAPGGFGDAPATLDFQQRVLERVAAVPGVEQVATASNLPVERGNWRSGVRFEGEVEGRGVDSYVVSDDYFATMGIATLQGRVPGPEHTADSPRVIAVNRAFVDEYLEPTQALGTPIHMAFAGQPFTATIVGVVENVRQIGLAEPPRPALYGSARQLAWPRLKVVLRSDGVEATTLRRAIRDVEPDVPVTSLATLEEHVGGTLVQPRFYTGLMAGFAALALLLAAAGIYSSTLYAVRARTREAGIRVALGARPRGVRSLIVRQGMRATTVGVGLGVLAALYLSRWLGSMLYGVSPTDALTFGAAAAVFLSVAWVASCIPARQATRVDVVQTLRGE